MDIQKEQELLQKIGVLLLDAVPAGWQEIVCTMSALGNIAECETHVTDESGQTSRLLEPMGFSHNILKLRKAVYQPGKGSWYTATYKITPPGSYHVDYDYDNEPVFRGPAPSAHIYALDLEYYPRDEALVPAWLREKSQEAED